MDLLKRALRPARRAFYNLDGPWCRRGLAEALGSLRYSRPALFDIDRQLAKVIPWRDGTFFEAGAHDGFTQSNTYFLERHCGWSGVLVEPIPELRAKCARRRANAQVFACALVAPAHAGEDVTIHFGDLMSTIACAEHAAQGLAVAGRAPYSAKVPGRTVTSVLDEAAVGAVDLMVLDLEGHEREAIEGIDMDRHAPKWLVVEALDVAATKPSLDALLADTYEPAAPLSPYDLFYERVR